MSKKGTLKNLDKQKRVNIYMVTRHKSFDEIKNDPHAVTLLANSSPEDLDDASSEAFGVANEVIKFVTTQEEYDRLAMYFAIEHAGGEPHLDHFKRWCRHHECSPNDIEAATEYVYTVLDPNPDAIPADEPDLCLLARRQIDPEIDEACKVEEAKARLAGENPDIEYSDVATLWNTLRVHQMSFDAHGVALLMDKAIGTKGMGEQDYGRYEANIVDYVKMVQEWTDAALRARLLAKGKTLEQVQKEVEGAEDILDYLTDEEYDAMAEEALCDLAERDKKAKKQTKTLDKQ